MIPDLESQAPDGFDQRAGNAEAAVIAQNVELIDEQVSDASVELRDTDDAAPGLRSPSGAEPSSCSIRSNRAPSAGRSRVTP